MLMFKVIIAAIMQQISTFSDLVAFACTSKRHYEVFLSSGIIYKYYQDIKTICRYDLVNHIDDYNLVRYSHSKIIGHCGLYLFKYGAVKIIKLLIKRGIKFPAKVGYQAYLSGRSDLIELYSSLGQFTIPSVYSHSYYEFLLKLRNAILKCDYHAFESLMKEYYHQFAESSLVSDIFKLKIEKDIVILLKHNVKSVELGRGLVMGNDPRALKYIHTNESIKLGISFSLKKHTHPAFVDYLYEKPKCNIHTHTVCYTSNFYFYKRYMEEYQYTKYSGKNIKIFDLLYSKGAITVDEIMKHAETYGYSDIIIKYNYIGRNQVISYGGREHIDTIGIYDSFVKNINLEAIKLIYHRMTLSALKKCFECICVIKMPVLQYLLDNLLFVSNGIPSVFNEIVNEALVEVQKYNVYNKIDLLLKYKTI